MSGAFTTVTRGCALMLGSLCVAASALGTIRAASPQEAPTTSVASSYRALVNRYCVTCHNDRARTGGLALDTLDVANLGYDAEVWEKVVRKLRAGMMPPPGRPRPDQPTYEAFTSWLEMELDRAAAAKPDPGRTETFHRLSRTEYRHAIRDLLALDVDVESILPADDASYGFDNIAGVLKVNQTRMERMLVAARKVSRMAMGAAVPVTSERLTLPDRPQFDRVEGLPFGTRGGTLIRHTFPRDGEYLFVIDLTCTNTRGGDQNCDGGGGFSETHELEILVDGEVVQVFTLESRPRRERYTTREINVLEVEATEQYLKARVPVKGGPRDVGVTFRKLPSVETVQHGYRLPFMRQQHYQAADRGMSTPMPRVRTVTIEGPFEATGIGDTPSRQAILTCQPTRPAEEAGCAKSIFSRLARRAYRRPVTEAEVQKLLVFYEGARTEGEGFEEGIQRALQALLVSPEFWYRIEREPAGVAPNSVYRINDLELASRLSFFLWSSIPDDELLDVAARGQLKNPAVLEHQVRRMLADERSRTLTTNFVEQWLQLRSLATADPNEGAFPDFDESLREGFKRETEFFIDSIMREDRSVLDMLTADYTFVNDRVARHYGIPNVQGSHFRRVTFSADNPRRGLLGHGSILTITSHPNRTSPVRRGKWILENLLGMPPPPPPANVPPFPENQPLAKALSVRERMAEHRKNPVCAACHAPMDPVGFALENFDPVGRFRTVEEDTGVAIDASGLLPDGTKFDGLEGFRQALVSHPERFITTMTQRLLTYALGRGVEAYDMPAVRRIVREAAPSYRFSSLILGIVDSMPFQMRRSAAPVELAAAAGP